MRRPFIGANWKMYKTIGEAESFAYDLLASAKLYPDVDLAIFPAFTALSRVGKVLHGTSIKMGAQNMHPESQGAFTGEISPGMLVDAGCSYVIIGHSERRHVFNESNEFINKKIKAALKHGLTPLLCIGETLVEKRSGATDAVCKKQLLASLAGLEPDDAGKIVVAYEPVWAIGTGENATPDDAAANISLIRELIGKEFGNETKAAVRILYGGSVKPNNAHEYFLCRDIDGALVGGASLDKDLLMGIVERAAGRKKNAI
ncbi:MAG: triose-phosphate isomerase [Desulfocucumaceae bacterium]